MLTILTAKRVAGCLGSDMEIPLVPFFICEAGTGHCSERRAGGALSERSGLTDEAETVCLPRRSAGYALTYIMAFEECAALMSGVMITIAQHGGESGSTWGEAALEGLKWVGMLYGLGAAMGLIIAGIVWFIAVQVRRGDLEDIQAGEKAAEKKAGL